MINARLARFLLPAVGFAGLAVPLIGAEAAAAATADVAVQKVVNQPKPNVGDAVQFTVTVSNGGPDPATGVKVQDALPAGYSFILATPSQGSYDAATGLWSVGSVATGVPGTLQISARVVSPNPPPNTASVTADQADPSPGNNSASATVTPQRADLSIAKSVDHPTPQVGDTVTFTLTLTNLGPDPATGVEVTDSMPPGLSFVSATPSQGTYAPMSGTWTVGSVPTTTSPSLQIQAQLTAVGRVVNTASISASDQFDPDSGNNSASLTVPRTPTQTSVSSSANPSPFGGQLIFTAVVAPVPDGGNVTFIVDGIPLGLPVPVDTAIGTATSQNTSTLMAGSHTVVAGYSGDANFLGSASPPLVQVVSAVSPPIAAVERITISPTSFAAASRGPSALASARRRPGAKVSYTLNESARVRFTVAALRPGRRNARGRCVKPTRENRRARACVRLVRLRGSFSLNGQTGRNRFRFTGRLARRKLPPGRYRLIATPSAGGQTGHRARVGFRIVTLARRSGTGS